MMTGESSGPADDQQSRPEFFASSNRAKIWLIVLIAIQLALYAWLCWLSRSFQFGGGGPTSPLGTVLVVLGLASVAYLLSIPAALRLSQSKGWVAVLILVAIVMRMVVVSEPIQEVDLYRYIWDGAVSSQRISPYEFAPAEVRRAAEAQSTSGVRGAARLRGAAETPHEATDARGDRLHQLVSLTREQPSLSVVLDRVHYAQLPTVYPPVSQFAFRFVDWLTPRNSDVVGRVRIMKSVIVLADLGVLLLLLAILSLLQLNAGWCIAYGWSPLVIKEFANSGHLDSIAMLLCMASLTCLAIVLSGRCRIGWRCWLLVLSSGILLGLGVGAKLYPVVLLPLTTCLIGKLKGRGMALSFAALTCLTGAIALAPMWQIGQPRSDPSSTQSLDGLTTFLSRWEINDLIFMVVQENVRPENSIEGQPSLWFAVTSDPWRISVTQMASQYVGGDVERTPFFLTRIVTTVVFGLVVLVQCRKTWVQPSLFFESAFLTLAWFWLLSPTQNPWYWCWALPLIPMAGSRTWLLMSGLTLIYYARFWFDYHPTFTLGWASDYQGVEVFDFVIVWIEFFPFLILLTLNWIRRRLRRPTCPTGDQSMSDVR